MLCSWQQPEDEGRGGTDSGLLPLPACKTLRTTWEVEKDARTLRTNDAFSPSRTKGSRDKRFCFPISPSVLKSLKKVERFFDEEGG